MTDLSAFNITNFAGGSRNLCIVDDLSANTSTGFSGSSNSSMSTESVTFQVSNDYNSSNDPLIVWTNATSALQILYPEHSIDPAQKPQGGAEFYAVPLDLTDARSVTLEYSVFFPQDFDWVLGGKLPGLYGGRQGCSGGDAALDCFSTRLMWRKYGQGELYLYAPKDKQTDSLCNNPQSVCDAAYGLSVGRGSFVFAPGNWTKVRQTVILNTPGQQDGCFTLDVNGNRVINRNDVYYRGNPLSPSGSLSSAKSDNGSKKMGSTFFGGHEKQYASPKDQLVWFKDFAMSNNG
ncbi:polysaccharide lyase family 14 protein [Lentinula aciculospora]|uniref:Polysaccharide lyase family 14 protein n=1 Tax=Lentinula aciculospora TaxID=153920 RepID=A0A9W9DL47_9AGAR|nr:polysaccharide lyase family 14 protein [Lentinula aciculospora]